MHGLPCARDTCAYEPFMMSVHSYIRKRKKLSVTVCMYTYAYSENATRIRLEYVPQVNKCRGFLNGGIIVGLSG